MQQRGTEWFAARKGRLTASSIGAVMGLDPYRGPDDVIRAMVREAHGVESEFKGNVATEYGTFHEAGALFDYELEYGNKVDPGEGFYTLGERLGASPDGLVNDSGLLEIKCPYGMRDTTPAKPFKTLAEQPHYYAQMQMQMLVTGREWCHFFQWCPTHSNLETVNYNEEYVEAELLPAVNQFFVELGKALDEPAPHLEPLRKEINTGHVEKLLAEYDDLTEAMDRAKERKADVLNELVRIADSKNALMHGRKLTLVERVGSVSYAKALKAIAPDADLEPYRGKPSKSWRLS